MQLLPPLTTKADAAERERPSGKHLPYARHVEAVAKSGSGLSDIVTSASYDSTCSNPVTCNEPNSTTDARGNVTDYT